MEFLAVNQHLRSVDRSAEVKAYLHTVPGYSVSSSEVTLSAHELDELDRFCIENGVKAQAASKVALRARRYGDASRAVADAISWTSTIADCHTTLAHGSRVVSSVQDHTVSLRHLSLAIYYHEKATESERRAINARLLGRYDNVKTFATEALLFFSLYREHAVQHNAMMGRELPTENQLSTLMHGAWTQNQIQWEILHRIAALGGILDASMQNERRIEQFLRQTRIKTDVAQVRSLLNRKGIHFEATRGIFTAATRPASR